MKKVFTVVACIVFLSACSILKKDKYGCPVNGRSMGAEKLASGDEKAMKKSAKAKYRGGKKSY